MEKSPSLHLDRPKTEVSVETEYALRSCQADSTPPPSPENQNAQACLTQSQGLVC